MPVRKGRRARLGSVLARAGLPVFGLAVAVLATVACQDVRPAAPGGCAVLAAESGKAHAPAAKPAGTGALATIAKPAGTGALATIAEPGGAGALAKIDVQRASFRRALLSTQGDAARRAVVLKEAARYLEDALIDVVLPRWDGTPWSFSGTSTTPRTGSIACGYFVSTTLEEAGVRVERRRLAQQAAEDIIKALVPPEAISRFSDVPVEKFAAAAAAKGDGLYVVGLDNHVGFLIVRRGEVLFHHSSYVGAAAVVREQATASAPLAQSRYRVFGKLFTDDALVEAWIRGTSIPTKGRVPG